MESGRCYEGTSGAENMDVRKTIKIGCLSPYRSPERLDAVLVQAGLGLGDAFVGVEERFDAGDFEDVPNAMV